jgi:hypothetical protein
MNRYKEFEVSGTIVFKNPDEDFIYLMYGLYVPPFDWVKEYNDRRQFFDILNKYDNVKFIWI